MIGPYFACLPRGESDLAPADGPLRPVGALRRFWATCGLQRDALLFLSFHYCVVTAPLLVWTVSVVARRIAPWQAGGPGGGCQPPPWLRRIGDALTLAPMAYMHVRFMRVVTAVMGWGPLLAGPAFGFVPPVCMVILWAGMARFPVRR